MRTLCSTGCTCVRVSVKLLTWYMSNSQEDEEELVSLLPAPCRLRCFRALLVTFPFCVIAGHQLQMSLLRALAPRPVPRALRSPVVWLASAPGAVPSPGAPCSFRGAGLGFSRHCVRRHLCRHICPADLASGSTLLGLYPPPEVMHIGVISSEVWPQSCTQQEQA